MTGQERIGEALKSISAVADFSDLVVRITVSPRLGPVAYWKDIAIPVPLLHQMPMAAWANQNPTLTIGEMVVQAVEDIRLQAQAATPNVFIFPDE